MTELTLFDTAPDDIPENGAPATVYGHKANIENGHLLIESMFGDWLFVYTGSDTVRAYFPGWTTGIDMTAEQLGVLGDYCRRMADRCGR